MPVNGVLLIIFVADAETQSFVPSSGLFAGGGAITGGLLMGPLGGLVGGILGSVIGFFQSDNYNGIVQQALELPEVRQQRLVRGVQQILAAAGATNLTTVDGFRRGLIEFASRRGVRDQVWSACLNAVEGRD